MGLSCRVEMATFCMCTHVHTHPAGISLHVCDTGGRRPKAKPGVPLFLCLLLPLLVPWPQLWLLSPRPPPPASVPPGQLLTLCMLACQPSLGLLTPPVVAAVMPYTTAQLWSSQQSCAPLPGISLQACSLQRSLCTVTCQV